MAERIRVELDDGTTKGFESINKNVDSTGKTISELRSEFERLAEVAKKLVEAEQELARAHAAAASGELRDSANSDSAALDSAAENVDDLKEKLDSMSSASKKTASSMDKLGDEAKQTASQIKEAGNAGDSFKSLDRLAKAVVSVELLKRAIQSANQAIKALSEDGSPAFVELDKATKSAYNSLLDLGNDPTVQTWASSLAKIIKDDLAPQLKVIPGYVSGIHDWLGRLIARTGEFTGLLPEGTVETLKESQAQMVKLNESAEKAVALEKERLNVDVKIKELQDKVDADRESANLQNIEDQQTLLTLLEEEIDKLRELERGGERDQKKKEEQFKKIEMLQRQAVKASDERADKEMRKQEEAAKYRYELEQKFQDSIIENAKLASDSLKAISDANSEKATKAAEFLLNAIQEYKDTFGKNLAQEAAAQLDPRKVAQQVAKQRGDKAEQQQVAVENERAKRATPAATMKEAQRREAESQRRIKQARRKAEMDAFREVTSGGSLSSGARRKAEIESRKAESSMRRAEQEKARAERSKFKGNRQSQIDARRAESAQRKATADAERAARSNRTASEKEISPTEVGDAQTELISTSINQARTTGRLSQTTAQMAQEAVRAQQASLNGQIEINQELDRLRRILSGITDATEANTSQYRNQRGSR